MFDGTATASNCESGICTYITAEIDDDVEKVNTSSALKVEPLLHPT